MILLHLPAGAGCLCLLAAGPVAAQTSPPDTRTSVRSWADADIVVTGRSETYAVPDGSAATRTDMPLIDVAQSIQVINRTLITEQDRRTLADVLVNVSGVTPVRSEEVLFTAPIVRGFPSEVYQDGLPFYGATQAANDLTSLVGVERIDVVKGPVSTLYAGGVGTPLGGLINVETVRPHDRVGGYVAIRGGSFGTIDPHADLNMPIAHGVAARVTGEYQSNDSWIDRLHGTRWSVQPGISFKVGPRTDLFVQGQLSRRSQLEYSGLPAAQALAGQIGRDVFPGAPDGQPNTTIDNRLATAILRHDFSDATRLTVSGRYYHSRSRAFGSFVFGDLFPPDPATPTTYPIFAIFLTGRTREATIDGNIQASVQALGGRHELLAGMDYDQTRFYSGLGFGFVPVGTQDLARPDYRLAFGPVPALPATPMLGGTQHDRYETVAGYVQDQATYGPLHLTASLRFTRLRFQEREQRTDEVFNRISPRLGASLGVVPGVAIYAAYATAFRGAFGITSVTSPRPETSRNVEGGVKLALPGTHLSGTVAAFTQNRRNVATPDPAGFPFSIQVGEQRARGTEIDLTWEPMPAFSLLATYAYTHAVVSRTTAAAGIPLGDRLPRVPRHGGRVAGRYRVLHGPAKGLSFGAGVTAFGDRQVTLPNSVAVPGYAAIDAQAAYDMGRFTLVVSAANLGGSRAFDTYQYLAFPVVIPTQPRSAFVTLKANI